MTYEPLHHKYRPQTFAELVGQEAIAATLSNALQQQKIAPAYLFTGARGTGKTSSARILAKSLNCLESKVPTAQPCGNCEVCRAIANGSALDIIEIDAASNTGVDNIRDLIEKAQFAPVQCRYKVYVVDECHMLSTAAFNALLKTLEEPPDRVVFVLATTDPQRVLPTIISRCQRFDFRRIPLTAMVEHLTTIAAKEEIPIAADALTLVAQIAQGGLRDAESLLDQLSLLSGEIAAEQVWDLVGSVPERDLLSLLEAIAQDDPEAMLDSTRRLMDRGREPLIVLQNLASFYRDLLIAKTAPDRHDLIAVTLPTWERLCQFAQQLEIGTILLGQQHLRSAEVQLKNTTQPRLWLEITLMGLLPSAIAAANIIAQPASAPPAPARVPTARADVRPAATPPRTTPLAERSSAPSSSPPPTAPPQAQPSPVSEPPVTPEAPPPPPPPTPAGDVDLEQVWQKVLGLVQPYSTQIMLRQQCQLLGFNGQEARIGARSQQLFNMAKERLPNVEAAFTQFCQHPVRVGLEVMLAGDSSPPAAPGSHPTPESGISQPPQQESSPPPPPSQRSPIPQPPEPPPAIAPIPNQQLSLIHI
ncbi:DNA polymerase III subunit gamma/tau, partial [Pantanalinema rosaneae CENA516]|uniref:DNA polymerase III subunit gamma/tau n=1 Tax=Pantanalinema rosaneae TaxID=1620701 RepID=UPI003D6F394F